MDALTLLCNLHADGPATLRRLQRAGVDRLEQIRGLAIDELAELLDGPPSLARRFSKEASVLALRTTTTLLEEEDPSLAPAGAAPVREHVLHPPTMPVASRPEPVAPALPASSGGTPLRPGLVEGLDAASCERFMAEGVRTLETLVASAGLQLARRLGMPLTRLLDLHYHATRFLDPAPARSNQRRGREPLTTAPDPRPSYALAGEAKALAPAREGFDPPTEAAGPFA